MVWKNVVRPERRGTRYACPCCKFVTLGSRGDYEICKVCFWEDDGQDEHDAEIVRGGPNYQLSLRQAQANYKAIGAVEERYLKFVRAPRAKEIPGKET